MWKWESGRTDDAVAYVQGVESAGQAKSRRSRLVTTYHLADQTHLLHGPIQERRRGQGLRRLRFGPLDPADHDDAGCVDIQRQLDLLVAGLRGSFARD